jgi:iron(III) transport system permease protein
VTAGQPTLSRPWTARVGLRLNGQSWLLAAVVAIAGVLVLPPLAFMVWSSLTPGGFLGVGGELSISGFTDLLGSPQLPRLLGNTAVFAVGSTVLGVGAGTLMAWLVERTNCAWRGLSYAAALIGFAIPGILRVIGWILLVNPHNGLLLRGLDLEGMGGMILIEAFFWTPLAFLLMVGPMSSLDAALEEAAALSGASPARTLRHITARLLYPSLLSVTILSLIRVVQTFEVPLLLGVPGKVRVLTTEVFESIHESAVPDYSGASAYGVVMVGLLLGVLYFYSRATRQASRYQTVTGKGFRPRRLDLGAWRFVGGVFLLVVFLVEALPAAALLYASLLPTLGADVALASFGLGNYAHLASFPGITLSVADSLLVAVVSATAAVVLAVAAAWLVVRGQGRGRSLVEMLIGLPLVFPGVVMSLGVLMAYLRLPVPVYGTVWILVLAYIPTFAPFAMRYLAPALLHIHRDLEDSAYMSGAPPLATFQRVLAPLLRPALVGAWIFVFMVSVRELSVAALLYTPHSPVVATQMLDMWTNGNANQLSAFGTVVALVSIGVAAVVFRATRRFGIQA